MQFEWSPLIVWIALWIGNTYPQVNIFSNKRDITKCQRFHIAEDNEDTNVNNEAMAIAIP